MALRAGASPPASVSRTWSGDFQPVVLILQQQLVILYLSELATQLAVIVLQRQCYNIPRNS